MTQNTKMSKSVTFGDNEVFAIENISCYTNESSFFNLLLCNMSYLKGIRELYVYRRFSRMSKMAEVTSMITNYENINHVDIIVKQCESDIFMKDLVLMIECGFTDYKNKSCTISLGNKTSLTFQDEMGNLICIDQNLDLLCNGMKHSI